MCTKNFNYFTANFDELYKKYPEKYISIKDEKIIGIYDSFDSAINESIKSEELGSFIVQFCSKNVDNNIGYFYSNNVSFSVV